MKAKELQIETCGGLVSLFDVNYCIRYCKESIKEYAVLTVNFSWLDKDYEKLHLIRCTQLKTGRGFSINDTDKYRVMCFIYPISLIKYASF